MYTIILSVEFLCFRHGYEARLFTPSAKPKPDTSVNTEQTTVPNNDKSLAESPKEQLLELSTLGGTSSTESSHKSNTDDSTWYTEHYDRSDIKVSTASIVFTTPEQNISQSDAEAIQTDSHTGLVAASDGGLLQQPGDFPSVKSFDDMVRSNAEYLKLVAESHDKRDPSYGSDSGDNSHRFESNTSDRATL